jgi:RNA polymerase subunit RPABC4/transcription elongation factor Spt4
MAPKTKQTASGQARKARSRGAASARRKPRARVTKPTATEKPKICDRCGAENPQDAEQCVECGKERFAPSWVRALRHINQNFSVQVTDPHADASYQEPSVTLYKLWPGGRSTLHIRTEAHWDRIKEIVDTELAEHLGWASKEKVAAEIRSRKRVSKQLEGDAKALLKENPELLADIAQGLKLDEISQEDLPRVAESLGKIAKILAGVDESHHLAIRQLVEKLPKQKAAAIRQLTDLMNELTIGQITAVTSEVRRRVALLETFTGRINDERTYEITGDESIHRLLERAMWIVDERSWLMHSNAQLRTVVTKELAKEDKRFEKRRPDFVCGAVDKKLIIIEIKRPSHTLDVADLNQLERYVVLCDKYDDEHSSFEALLVGSKTSDDLKTTLKVRGSGAFKVRTYTQLVSDTERRYRRYLDALS